MPLRLPNGFEIYLFHGEPERCSFCGSIFRWVRFRDITRAYCPHYGRNPDGHDAYAWTTVDEQAAQER